MIYEKRQSRRKGRGVLVKISGRLLILFFEPTHRLVFEPFLPFHYGILPSDINI